jgi:AraC-like DNA-binding protein/Tfp pilus assembly protein PilF
VKNFVFLLLFFISAICNGQNKKLDSLYRLLDNHREEDTTRVDLIFEILRYEFYTKNDTVVRLMEEAVEISTKVKYNRGLVRSYSFLGDFYQLLSDYDKVAEYGMKIIEINEKYGLHNRGGAYGYLMLGGVHSVWKNYEKALFYHRKYLEIHKAGKGRWRHIAAAYGNIAGVHFNSGAYDSALYYYNKALELDLEQGDLHGACGNYVSMAHTSYEKEDYTSALAYYMEGLRLAREINNKYAVKSVHNEDDIMSLIHLGLAEVYAKKGQYEKGIEYADSSLVFAKNAGRKTRIRDSYEVLFVIEKLRGNFAGALKYKELQVAYGDSIFSEDKMEQTRALEARFETQKKEQAIQILYRDKKIATLWKNIAFTALAIVLLISLIVMLLFRYKERKNRELFNLRIDFLLAENKELSAKYKFAVVDSVSETLESHDQRILKKALEIIENNLSDPLFGVEKLADELSMSRDSLHRRLKTITGFPPSDFIRSIRLKRAAAMLRNQSDTIAQIGFSVGFKDQSYFSKSFKKEFGVSPTDFVRSETTSS